MFRFLAYVIFSLVAAPIEIWSYIFNSFGEVEVERSQQLYNHPWSAGLIYVLSILLLAETIFRLASHWDDLKGRTFPKIIAIFSFLSFIFLFFFYAFAEKNRIIDGNSLWDENGTLQNVALIVALSMAWISYLLIHKLNEPKNTPDQ